MMEQRDLRHEYQLIERAIRRAEKQKANQPRNKKFTAEAYAAYTKRDRDV